MSGWTDRSCFDKWWSSKSFANMAQANSALLPLIHVHCMVCWASSRNSTTYLLKVVNGVWVMALSVFVSKDWNARFRETCWKMHLGSSKKGGFLGAQKLARLSRAMTSASRKLCATSTRVCFLAANTHLHEASVFLAP